MPYRPTGNPPGRPRKDGAPPGSRPKTKPVKTAPPPETAAPQSDGAPRILTRARKAFREAAGDPTEGLHRPPRRREVGRRPILHAGVIGQA